MIPNFFEAESSSIGTLTDTGTKINKAKTPLCANNSYLNLPNSGTRNSSKNCSFNKMNKTNNQNGSFLDVKTANIDRNLKQNKAPTLVVSNADYIPCLKLPDIDRKLDCVNKSKRLSFERSCTCCGANMNIMTTNKNVNLFEEFDLKSIDYSPNKKCSKFIEANNFSSYSPKSMNMPESLVNIHSSAKKSLLAKAISNNAVTNEKSNNLSMENLSILSSSSSLSPCSSITSLIESPSIVVCNKISKAKSLSHANISELCNDETSINKPILCDDCWSKNKQKKTENADNSDVSLIEIDNDDENTETKQNNSFKKKRKMRLSVENDIMNGIENSNLNDNRRQSALMLSSNNESNKKFKNQVTSTPAAHQLLSGKNTITSCQSNRYSQNYNNNDGMYQS